MIDQYGCVFEHINADELALLVIVNVDQGILPDFLRTFNVPLELHGCAVSSCCIKAAVTPYYCTGISAD